MRSLAAIVGMGLLSPIILLALLISTRLFVEARFLPSEAMKPTFVVNDRVLVEKASGYLKKPFARGEIIVFYPPPIEMGGRDLSPDVTYVLGRLTGLPMFPYEPAFIKRVIGLPGDQIRIESGQGVFLNGRLLDESSYLKEPANYTIKTLGDIGGRDVHGVVMRPYGEADLLAKPIEVPSGSLFVLGDNRNNSEDSHVFGFVKEDRIVGRVQLQIFPRLRIIEIPKYENGAVQ